MIWIPAGRLLAILDKADPRELTWTEQRFIRTLRDEGQEFVSLRRADNLLTRLDLDGWWHIPKDDGGLADIYEDGAQYGCPPFGSRLLLSEDERAQRIRDRRNAANRARSRWSNPEPRACVECGTVYTPPPGRPAQHSRFCAKRCRDRARRRKAKVAA